jgi:ABC-type polysaccharide/polyol phosphate transport system ATPase subunit
MAVAISVSNVSKRFRLAGEKPVSLKERVVRRRKTATVDFWALRDVDLEIDEGQTIGLLGHNGSGKSTLLKLVGGILQPTTGEIAVRGRVASLLELGAGFHPELTGRENVYLNGAILGLSQKELRRRFDDIVEFAELEQFIDTQVRNYSSGMYVRLGFAVAVNVDPDVLLVDEVLTVGDENFQRKCLDRVHELQQDGRTIVVVSHATDLMRRTCDRIAVLDHGQLVTFDAPGEAIRVFREHLLQDQLDRQAFVEAKRVEEHAPQEERGKPPAAAPPPTLSRAATVAQQEARRNFKVRITAVELDHPHRADRPYLHPGEPLTLRIGYDAVEPVEDVVFGIAVFDHDDGSYIFGANTKILGMDLPTLEGRGELLFEIDSVPLLDGTYPITIGIHSHDDGTVYDWSEQRHWFEVMNPDGRVGTVAMDITVKLSTHTEEADPPLAS